MEHGFTFICNSSIARKMLWRHCHYRTNEVTNLLFNNVLKYLENVSLGNKNRTLQIDNQIRASKKYS